MLSARTRAATMAASLFCAAASLHAAVPQSQRDALIAVYNATGGSSWTTSTGWLGTAGTECDWYGITCNNDRNSVTAISLAENNLTGPLPAQIGAFPALADLNLYGNKLTTIPREIGSLTALEELRLGANRFSGAIPDELGSFPRLTYLDLSQNEFSGGLPDKFAALVSLQTFSVEDNSLSGSLPSWLDKWANAVDVRFSYNKFNGPIPPSIGSLRNLEILDLSVNDLSGSLPPQLGDLASLQRLWLFGNDLSGSIPPDIAKLTRLEDFLAGGNDLSGSIPPQLGSLPALKNLFLSRNELTGSIPSELAQIVTLEQLAVDDNHLDGTLPARILRMPALQTLQADHNRLTGSIPTDIDAPLLRDLSLNENLLTGTIPTQLKVLSNLEILHLNDNALTGPIPSELSKLAKLRELNLSNNQLTGSIPPVLSQNSALEELRLSWNPLSGQLPPELFSLLQLHSLELIDLSLTGSIPADIGNLTLLESLYLGGNQLTGSIPSSIGKLARLLSLQLANNSLSGDVPVELFRLTALESLELQGNSLSGTIPPDIGGMTSLQSLYISENRFNGSLPSDLGKLTSLQWLDVSANQFRGAVPSELANLKNLGDQSSDFGYNALYTTDATLSAFLDKKQGGSWSETQTVPPTNVAVSELTDRSAVISWTPIAYTWDDGGYQVTATPRTAGSPVVKTTFSKDQSSFLVRSLQAATTYDFVVRTVSHPHDRQQSLLTSDATAAISGTTTAKVSAPADVDVTSLPTGLVQIGGTPQNTDNFVVTNFGDLPTNLTVTGDGSFFQLSPTTFTLPGGASQTVTITSVPQQPAGAYDGDVTAAGDGVNENFYVHVRLLSIQQVTGRAVAEATTSRVDIAGDAGGTSVGSAVFVNKGTAVLYGILVSDVPWITVPPNVVTIDPGATYAANFTVVRSKRSDAAASGTLTGSLRLVYVDGSSPTATLAAFDPKGTTPTPGLGVTIVTVVDTAKPAVAAGEIPAPAAGEVVRFLAGISTLARKGEQFVTDMSVSNTFGVAPISDLRMYLTTVGASGATMASFGAIQPSHALSVSNVTPAVYGSSSSIGTVQIRTADWNRLLVNARLSNRAAGGGMGTAVPVFRSDRAAVAGGQIVLTGVRSNAGEHTNLYVQETAGAAATVQIEFLDSAGAAVGAPRAPDSLARYSLLELADGVPDGAVTVVVTNVAGSLGRVIAYAVVVDDRSADTWAIVDWNGYYDFAAGSAARLPFVQTSASTSTAPPRRRAVSHAVTATQDATDLTLFNPGTIPATLRLQYRDANDKASEQTLALAARQTVTIADVAKTFSAGAVSPGTITIEPIRGTFSASSRTSRGIAQGAVGTAVPLLAATAGLRVGQRQTFSGIDDSAAGRTSPPAGTQSTGIGLLEMSGSAATVRATILLSDGRSPVSVSVSRDFVLRANQLTFIDSITTAIAAPFAAASWGDLHDLQIDFEVVAGSGAVTPFLFVTRSDTGDTMLRVE